MSPREVFATLVNEPFFLTPPQIGDLTPWQVRHLYLCERDDAGRIQPDPRPEADAGPPRDAFYWFHRHWELNGLRPDLIDRLWRETNEPA